MKIEKLSDTQIRCTLNQADLSQRELKLSELAYGTEKAKLLFKDMMKQASYEFGFEAEDIPLMIEAIPISTDCIVLVVTKVEDPAELDTRFSKFAPAEDDDDDDFIDDFYDEELDSDDMNDIFNHVFDYDEPSMAGKMPFASSDRFAPFASPNKAGNDNLNDDYYETSNIFKVFSFSNLDTVGKIAHIIRPLYNGTNCLYKNPSNGRYLLVLSNESSASCDLNNICTALTEYGKKEKYSLASDAFLKEHCTLIIDNNAISVLDEVMN